MAVSRCVSKNALAYWATIVIYAHKIVHKICLRCHQFGPLLFLKLRSDGLLNDFLEMPIFSRQ